MISTCKHLYSINFTFKYECLQVEIIISKLIFVKLRHVLRE